MDNIETKLRLLELWHKKSNTYYVILVGYISANVFILDKIINLQISVSQRYFLVIALIMLSILILVSYIFYWVEESTKYDVILSKQEITSADLAQLNSYALTESTPKIIAFLMGTYCLLLTYGVLTYHIIRVPKQSHATLQQSPPLMEQTILDYTYKLLAFCAKHPYITLFSIILISIAFYYMLKRTLLNYQRKYKKKFNMIP